MFVPALVSPVSAEHDHRYGHRNHRLEIRETTGKPDRPGKIYIRNAGKSSVTVKWELDCEHKYERSGKCKDNDGKKYLKPNQAFEIGTYTCSAWEAKLKWTGGGTWEKDAKMPGWCKKPGMTGTPKPSATPKPTDTPVPTSTPAPTATPEPSATPAPSVTDTPIATPTPGDERPPAANIGPAFPTCTEGTALDTFGTYTLAVNRSDIPEEVILTFTTPDDFVARPGTLRVLQGEGHNWDEGYAPVNGPKSLLTALPDKAKQFQSEERIDFSWGASTDSLTMIGGFVDHSPGGGSLATDVDNVTTEYTFPLAEIRPGVNVLKMTQPGSTGPNSIFVKGTVCVDPIPGTPTPTPTEVTPTPTDTEPSPTVTPSLTPTPTMGAPPPVCVEETTWSSKVEQFNQGKRKDGLGPTGDRSDISLVPGQADSRFVSLGQPNGNITVSFLDPVAVRSGKPELVVYETSFMPSASTLERAKVEVSLDGVTYYEVGMGSNLVNLGINFFDIESSGLTSFKYVRITDMTDYSLPGHDGFAEGYDVDAVAGLRTTCR
jgi:hypothetical protein